MLKEIAIADAYGAGFEFSLASKVISNNDLRCYLPHDLYGFQAKYTDDTQMSIAIAKLLLLDESWNDELIASMFVCCFKRDVRLGYSSGFHKLLMNCSSGRELLENIKPISERNGAAMRSVPLGFLRDKKNLLRLSKLQSAITHNTEIAIKSSCAVALAAHFGIHLKGGLSDLRRFLETEGYADWDFDWKYAVTMNAHDTVSAALSCLLKCDNLHDLLQMCVGLCGDTDSVASIAVGIACCFDEYERNLPQHLFESLDEVQYGLDYLDSLECQLVARYVD